MASLTSAVEALSSLFTTINCNNAVLTLLLHDWLLCLDQEFACIWKAAPGGLNAGSLVYALSRFAPVMGMVLSTASIFPLSLSSCRSVDWAVLVFDTLSRISILMFSAFRVYAVSRRKVAPTLLVSLLSTAPIINSLIVNGGFTAVEMLPSPFNCSDITRISPQWNFRAILITRIPLIAAEVIVVGITWKNRVCKPDFKEDHWTLGAVLLRDGSLYFIVLALLNALHIILTAVSIDLVDASASYVTIFLDPISSILTCRFILNLRQVDHSRMSSTLPSGGDVHFAAQGSRSTLPRFIASFGEPLHAAQAASEDDGEDEA